MGIMKFNQIINYIAKLLSNKWTGQIRLNIFKGNLLKVERKEEINLEE